ncbi:MAG TPA: hypothetical protein VK927_01550, partial [Adhaeribacter sp.]|nr:hypothetical protein [Adhaeribacter sp.]
MLPVFTTICRNASCNLPFLKQLSTCPFSGYLSALRPVCLLFETKEWQFRYIGKFDFLNISMQP